MKKLLNIIRFLIIFEVLIVIALIVGSILISYLSLIPLIIIIAIIPILCTIFAYKEVKDNIPQEKISEEKLQIYHQNCYNEFIVFYNRLKNYNFDDMEYIRKSLKISNILFWVIQVIVILAFIIFVVVYLLLEKNEIILYAFAFILTLPYTLLSIFYKSKIDNRQKKYNIEYKEKIISSIVKNYNNKFSYTPYIETSDKETLDYLLETYAHSKTIDSEALYYTQIIDDYIVYESNDYSMKIFNAYYDGKKVSNKTNVFVEIVTKIPLDNEVVFVSKRLKENYLNYLSEKLIKRNIEDKEFNKYFDVYSKNKNIEILNSDIIKELKMAYEITPKGFILRIVKNKIYINFRTENMFDDNIFSKFLNKNTLVEQYCLLDSIYKLANNISKEIKKEKNN